MIVDTHAHLTHESLLANIAQVIDDARAAQVGAMLTVGTTLASSKQCIILAEQHAEVRAAVGIHPNDCCQAQADDWSEIESLCRHPRVAALGETGLDRHWKDCPWETQVAYFRKHLELSRTTELPVVVHTRECAEEALEVLQQEARLGPIRGVMHSYTGSIEVAEACVELGLFISFAGMVTFKNAQEIHAVARRVPADRLLVETDSPYLTPHPFRGKRPNHPALVAHTLRALAKLRDVGEPELIEQTTQNAQRLFGAW